jgi:hypothetical protein
MGTDDGIDDGPDGAERATEPEGIGGPAVLVARGSTGERRLARRRRLQFGTVAVLVALGCTSFTFAAVGVWVRRNVTDTDVRVARAGPLADGPAVRAALRRWLSGEVVGPFELAAGPAAGGVEGT